MHSTSSQSSSIGRPRTKAALKGYENLKVSIPTTGLDLQQALDRSPNSNGCKLSALAEIALGTDVPIVGEMLRSKYLSPKVSEEKPTPSMVSPTASSKEISSPTKLIVSKASVESSTAAVTSSTSPSKSSESLTRKELVRQAANKLIGNKLGFKERKKKQPPAALRKNTSNKKSDKSLPKKKPSNLPKDIYDFEESADSIEDTIKPLTHTRVITKEEPRKSEHTDEPETAKIDDAEEESTYSDRDGFFNYNSVDNSDSDEDEESEAESVMTKKSAKAMVPVQKKCLIMGRIFKNAKKDPEPSKLPKVEKKREVIKSMVKKQMNDIFDDLRGRKYKSDAHEKKTKETAKKEPPPDEPDDDDDEKAGRSATGRPRKSREIISLEAEWGMSIEEIKDLIGVGKRKIQRRCAKQKKCVETWSSDEYEEFHSTKDIISMIQEAEMKAQRTKNKASKHAAVASDDVKSTVVDDKMDNDVDVKPAVEIQKPVAVKKATEPKSETLKESKKTKPKLETRKATFSGIRSEESDHESDGNRTAKRAKIKNRRRTIAFREDVYEEEEKTPIKARRDQKECMTDAKKASVRSTLKSPMPSTALAATSKPPAPNKIEPTTKTMKQVKPMPRRKRIASEMLYYWSSSSDEEFGRIKPNENEDDEDDNHLEQHGWIVGDSHKKLVTLLAHAKGKKIEDCAVKEAIHKKKSS